MRGRRPGMAACAAGSLAWILHGCARGMPPEPARAPGLLGNVILHPGIGACAGLAVAHYVRLQAVGASDGVGIAAHAAHAAVLS